MKFKEIINIISERNKFLGPKWTIEKLLQKQKEIQENPKYKNPDENSIFKYTPQARKMLDDITWAITYSISEKKKKEKEESLEDFKKRKKIEIERKYNKSTLYNMH